MGSAVLKAIGLSLLLFPTLAAQLSQPPATPAPAGLLAYWETHPKSPVQYVVDTFNRGKRWVVLGEFHRIRHDAQLVLDLIPELHRCTDVRYLATEFLSVEATDEANRLVTQATFDRVRALRFFMRDNPIWNNKEYFDILETIWRSNKEHAASRGVFRLIGLAPAIDWSIVNYGEGSARRRELEKADRYDECMARALERQILAKDLPALVHCGIAHATAKYTEYWVGTDKPLHRMGNMIYHSPYKERMWIVSLHASFYDSATRREVFPFGGLLDRLMLTYRRDIGFDVLGTPFEKVCGPYTSPQSQLAHTFGEMFDGYIIRGIPMSDYLGTSPMPDWVQDESNYQWYRMHVVNKAWGEALSKMTFAEYKQYEQAHTDENTKMLRQKFQALGQP
jgi:hypothetical protein